MTFPVGDDLFPDRDNDETAQAQCPNFIEAPIMNSAYLDARKNPCQPRTTVTLQLPDDMIANMERIAPYLACSDAISLMRLFLVKGLRESLDDLQPAISGGTPDVARAEQLRRCVQAAAENLALCDADRPHFSDLPLEQQLAIVRAATRNAVETALAAGRTVTGIRNGEIVDYQPTNHEI